MKIQLSHLAGIVVALPILLIGTGKAVARDYYGAITYSEDSGAHGYSYDYATRRAAETRALSECESNAGTGDCEVLVWFKNGCGALATAPDGAYGSGWAGNRTGAEDQAISSCSQYARGCRVKRWVCTTR
ncbi:MAG: DUF4189 domain-containing protein [Leptolyngbyaceae bacterium]|nr:DUF4189 domain-containing protein [Leptolyngbyaceae bacterium]